MRRWLPALFAVVMLLSVQGVVWASKGVAGRMSCQAPASSCAAMDAGGACACCGTPSPSLSEVCGAPGSRCDRSLDGGTSQVLLDQHRADRESEGRSTGHPEPLPWLRNLSAPKRVDAAPISLRLPGREGYPDVGPGGRDRLTRLRLLRI